MEILSTMQNEPLSLATLLESAVSAFSDAEISTWTGDGLRRMTFGELGAESARLAHALTELGVQRGDRVATFMWNNNEHLTAYAAVPAMGAVLHALNIRPFPNSCPSSPITPRTRSSSLTLRCCRLSLRCCLA